MARNNSAIPPEFYNREVLDVARELLGKKLVRVIEGKRISGLISECEAYRGEEDLACHAHVGLTPRTSVMYGPPGHAYVYFTYGMHWLLNCVTGHEGYPAAVLLRSIIPTEGFDIIAKNRRDRPPAEWCNGPAKICKALQVDKKHNGLSLCESNNELFIENGISIPKAAIHVTPRIGMGTVPEPWFSKPWRFFVEIASGDIQY